MALRIHGGAASSGTLAAVGTPLGIAGAALVPATLDCDLLGDGTAVRANPAARAQVGERAAAAALRTAGSRARIVGARRAGLNTGLRELAR